MRLRDIRPGTPQTDRLFGMAGLNPSNAVWPDTNTNSRDHDRYTRDDLARWPGLVRAIDRRAVRYGYQQEARQ